MLPEHPEDEELHAIRKRAKRARYANEAVEPAFGKPARGVGPLDHRRAGRARRAPGRRRRGDWLRRAAAAVHDEGAAFAAGELVAAERAAADAGRAAWSATWRDTARKKHRTWL